MPRRKQRGHVVPNRSWQHLFSFLAFQSPVKQGISNGAVPERWVCYQHHSRSQRVWNTWESPKGALQWVWRGGRASEIWAQDQVKSLCAMVIRPLREQRVPGRSWVTEVPDLWVAKMRLVLAAASVPAGKRYHFVIFLFKERPLHWWRCHQCSGRPRTDQHLEMTVAIKHLGQWLVENRRLMLFLKIQQREWLLMDIWSH